jgi:hypothetical protein
MLVPTSLQKLVRPGRAAMPRATGLTQVPTGLRVRSHIKAGPSGTSGCSGGPCQGHMR